MLYSNNIFELTSHETIWEDDKNIYISRAADDRERSSPSLLFATSNWPWDLESKRSAGA